MRIGITIGLTEGNSIFSNGLNQNILMLYKVLSKIKNVTKVSLIDLIQRPIDDYQKFQYLNGYDLEQWDNNIQHKYDLMICMGITPNQRLLDQFKKVDSNRIIAYKCGNVAALQMESLIFQNSYKNHILNKIEKLPILEPLIFDEMWMVPQQEFHNLQILEVQHKTKVRSVPFIWSNMFIEQHINLMRSKKPEIIPFFDDKHIDRWRVATMEPNQNSIKNMYPIIWIFEHANRIAPELFEKFKITNALEFSKSKYLIKMVHELTFYKDKKLQVDPRWSVIDLLANKADAVVSHQWGNPLNYAYFDVVYMGYPLIHNANLCQDLGYYYEDWKVKDAGELLVNALKTRKSDVNYTSRNRNILNRYDIGNEDMINQYELLINNLWEKNEINDKKYHWETNLLK